MWDIRQTERKNVYTVEGVNLPASIDAILTEQGGRFYILMNATLPEAERGRVLAHEFRHIDNGDMDHAGRVSDYELSAWECT